MGNAELLLQSNFIPTTNSNAGRHILASPIHHQDGSFLIAGTEKGGCGVRQVMPHELHWRASAGTKRLLVE